MRAVVATRSFRWRRTRAAHGPRLPPQAARLPPQAQRQFDDQATGQAASLQVRAAGMSS